MEFIIVINSKTECEQTSQTILLLTTFSPNTQHISISH